MKFKIAGLAAGIGLTLTAALPLLAHHSFSAEFDTSKPVTLKGKFVKMDWVNPHSQVYFNVTGDDGKVTEWRAETPPPNGLYRSGWRKNMLKEGDEITVQGFMAKDGDNIMWSQTVVLPDGSKLTLNSAPNATSKE
jgi:hypothetical protein